MISLIKNCVPKIKYRQICKILFISIQNTFIQCLDYSVSISEDFWISILGTHLRALVTEVVSTASTRVPTDGCFNIKNEKLLHGDKSGE